VFQPRSWSECSGLQDYKDVSSAQNAGTPCVSRKYSPRHELASTFNNALQFWVVPHRPDGTESLSVWIARSTSGGLQSAFRPASTPCIGLWTRGVSTSSHQHPAPAAHIAAAGSQLFPSGPERCFRRYRLPASPQHLNWRGCPARRSLMNASGLDLIPQCTLSFAAAPTATSTVSPCHERSWA
jgi:hypothetical protein